MDTRIIYSSITFDMTTGEVLACIAEDYTGTVAECGGGKGGGGSSSTTVTVDYGYNARMASISEEQQDWAREYMDVWRDYYKPYEIAQAQANLDVLPLEMGLYKQTLNSASQLLPAQTEASQKFLAQSVNGVDVNERMGLAKADVASAWKNVSEQNARENARMGVNPNSGRFQGVQAALGTQQAAQTAGAVTQARVGAEQENYDRLLKAAQVNPVTSTLQGTQFLKG
ncbi:MAG: hypothetical protein LBR82_01940 [Desulfovibrio sp.]|jgi:hypothetical protein|nr:hypothetical protein [Desulfovibrio sp.]